MDTAESSAPRAHPSTEEHDETVEAHHSGPERPRPHACTGGRVFVGYVDEHGEEGEASYACNRCAGSPRGRGRNRRGDLPCRECDGTGWVPYRSETVEGGFEEAYRLCPEGCAPRYCMVSSNDRLCPRPATVRRGRGYYCGQHAAHRPR
jgi:hypothetical protein